MDYVIFFGLITIGCITFLAGMKRKHTEPVQQLDIEYLKTESPIERKLYKALILNGYIVRTQVHCGKYRIDLALPVEWIAIECDGKDFHSTPEQKASDRRKNTYLRKAGWRVLRFTGSDINGNLNGVLKRIKNNL